ncbi:phage baseplate protein, partial [Yersinia enterocolitica]
VQDADQMSNTTASLIGPLNVQNDAVIKGVSVSGHNHNVTGVQSGGSTVTSQSPNPV